MIICLQYLKNLINLWKIRSNYDQQAQLTKIKSKVNKSIFVISLKDKNYEVIINIIKENEDNKIASLSFHDLKELRDRALLSKYIIEQKSKIPDIAQESETYEKFVKFVDKLDEYIDIINQLENSLYRDQLKVEGNFEIYKGDLTQLIQ